jgi:hypothetical protein
MDVITRRLRENGQLPTGGRGFNAPIIGPHEAAIILIAVAGSPKAHEADVRAAKLGPLHSEGRAGSRTLLNAVAALLSNPSELDALSEVRIARTTRRAKIIFRNGKLEEFRTGKSDPRSDRFDVEGILSAPLLALVARSLGNGQGKQSIPEGGSSTGKQQARGQS